MNVEQRILGAAGHLLGASLTGGAVLRRGARNLVLQARSRSASGPGEVIIKAATEDEHLLLNERAALRFLGASATTQTHVPRLLASNPGGSVLVTEYIAGETLESILAQSDPDRATTAVLTIAHALGRLHAATAGRRDEWDACGSPAHKPTAQQGEAFRELAPAILRFCERARIKVATGFRDELGSIARTIERPAPWLTFTVGDLAPSNIILGAHGPVFVDLEYADFRHAGYDASFWHSICPIPERIARGADRAYYMGWVDIPSAAGSAAPPDETAFLEQTAIMAGHRTFWSLTWNAGRIWDEDFEDVPGVSARVLRRMWLRGFARVARRAQVLPTLAATAEELDDALGQHWPATRALAVLFPGLGPID